jgi:predicted ATP-grasp superfamily ATP-dependent carboligase
MLTCVRWRLECTTVLFKPRNHFSFYLPGRVKNVTFHEPDELTAYFAAYPHLADMGVLQEIILGGDGHILVCAAYLDRNSKPLAVYTGRKIRQLMPDFGVTSYGISENLPEIADMTMSFLQRINYSGLVAVEYVRDRTTGELYFLEINGRSYYHNALFLSCGVNLPWIAYLDAVRHPMLAREVGPRQTYGVKWVDFARDTRSFRLKHRRAARLRPWLRSWAGHSFAVFALTIPDRSGTGVETPLAAGQKGVTGYGAIQVGEAGFSVPGVPGHVDQAPRGA